MTTAEILQAHIGRMNEIAEQDVKHTEEVQGAIRHIAERALEENWKVAAKLETKAEEKPA